MIGVVCERCLDTVDRVEQRSVAGRGSRPAREQIVELLDLSEADGGREVVEAVVVAETGVLEPAAGVGTALVRQALQEAPCSSSVATAIAPPSPVVTCLFG